ncbi:MAG TPA: DUF4412 domain-containing protein [Anditalea sp.]|nr:DUF4412 domain-containing protein [Anditalea sp.]
MRLSNIIILILIFFSVEASHAQLLNRIKNTAQKTATRVVERKIEREVEKAVERQIERSWTNIFGEQTDAEGNPIDFSKIMIGMDMDVSIEDHYEFQGLAILEMSGTDHKGKPIEPMLIHSYMGKNDPYTAMKMDNQQSENMIMIFDTKNNATIILMDDKGEKSSIAYSIDWSEVYSGEAMPSESNYSEKDFRKTGKTKTILGHLCEEYEVDDDEGTGNFWITKEDIGSAAGLWGNSSPFFAQKMKNQNPDLENLPQGSMLEMNYKSKKDKSSSTFLMKELDPEKVNLFDMNDYPNMMKTSQQD